jgi:hypothetical protein
MKPMRKTTNTAEKVKLPLKSSLFWDVTQRRLVVRGSPETSVTINLLCVTPNKSQDLIYTVAEA